MPSLKLAVRCSALQSNSSSDRIAHLGCAHFLPSSFEWVEDVTRAVTRVDGLGDSVLDGHRRVIQAEAVTEHQRTRKNLRNWIRQILPGDVRCGAARRFI